MAPAPRRDANIRRSGTSVVQFLVAGSDQCGAGGTLVREGRVVQPEARVLNWSAASRHPPGCWIHTWSTTGKDAGKKAPGRKRGIAVDIMGLIIAVVVFAASAHDNQVGTALLTKVAAQAATVKKALVDQ